MQLFITHHFPQLLKTSGEAGVLILLVLAVQWIFARRLTPRWRYALWLLVMLRLALPLTVSSPASLFNWLDVPASPAALTAKWNFYFGPHSARTRITADSPAKQDSEALIAETAVPRAGARIRWILGVWAGGVLVFGISLAAMQFRLTKRIRRQRPLIDSSVLNLLEDCKQVMGVRVPLTLVETTDVGSPTLFGFVRPRLLLPAGLAEKFSAAELRYVFLHELAHIKRNDILAGWLMTGLQMAHWFNPLVWLAAQRMRVDRELACDALALSFVRREENQLYGETIIKLLENFGRSAWAPSMAGAVENKKQLKERIRMIAKFKQTNRGITLAVALLAGLGITTLTDAQSGSPEIAKDLIGTWVFVGSPGAVGVAPAAGGRFKDITDTTFKVTQTNTVTGAELFDHGGNYTLKGHQYAETVDHATATSSNLIGKTFNFKINVKGDTFTQMGVKNPWNEVWKRAPETATTPEKISTDALQGTWMDMKDGVSIVIHGSTIEFREADTNQWIKASFSAYDTKPKQIAAVITECADPDAVGMPAFGIYDVKDGALTMSGFAPGTPAVPKDFDAAAARKIIFKKQ